MYERHTDVWGDVQMYGDVQMWGHTNIQGGVWGMYK